MTDNSKFKFGAGRFVSVGQPLLATVGAAVLVAGCSADVTRFSGPGFNLSGDDTASLSPPVGMNGGGTSNLSEQTPAIGYGGGVPTTSVQTSALPTASGNSDYYRPTRSPSTAYRPPLANDYGRDPAPDLSKGRQITVERGDTLYGLSRRHGVSAAELMTVNGLDSSMLRVGQRLHLPAGASTASASVRDTKTRRAPQRQNYAAAQPADVPATWNAHYAVRPGDSLYSIARQYGVKSSELQRYNTITDPRRVMPGTVLRVPGGTSAPVAQSNKAGGTRYAALTDGRTSDASPTTKGVQTVSISPPRTTPAAATPKSTGESGELLWPVRGQVISSFGTRPDGTHNDGINFSVPAGTNVMAADDGVVAYAGSELRSYGNLILLRHDNGWVTAYAHNEKLLVGRGDKVKKGQFIAKSGATGQVDRPQLHFELRQSSKKPVDPIPYLQRL